MIQRPASFQQPSVEEDDALDCSGPQRELYRPQGAREDNEAAGGAVDNPMQARFSLMYD
jgi:hypothetical protein